MPVDAGRSRSQYGDSRRSAESTRSLHGSHGLNTPGPLALKIFFPESQGGPGSPRTMTDNAGNKHEVYTLSPEFAGIILLDNPASDPAKYEGALSIK